MRTLSPFDEGQEIISGDRYERWLAGAVEEARKLATACPELHQEWINYRNEQTSYVSSTVQAIRLTAEKAKKTGRLEADCIWNSEALNWLLADFAEEAILDRYEKATAPAMGASKRVGRL